MRFHGLLLILSLAACGAQAGDTEVRIKDGRFSLKADNVMLSELISRLGENEKINVAVAPEVDRPVSISIHNRTLEQALHQLARQEQLNLVLSWQTLEAQTTVISGIKLLPAGNMDPSTLPSREQTWHRAALREENRNKSRHQREKR